MKLYSEENPNHPNPRGFLLWTLGVVGEIKEGTDESADVHWHLALTHSRLDELEREIISFVSFMDDLVEREELQQ
jgi:hypothetical protein